MILTPTGQPPRMAAYLNEEGTTMLKKILVPVDGSAFGECALPTALMLSRQADADVRLAMVNQPAGLMGGWEEAFQSTHMTFFGFRMMVRNWARPSGFNIVISLSCTALAKSPHMTNLLPGLM